MWEEQINEEGIPEKLKKRKRGTLIIASPWETTSSKSEWKHNKESIGRKGVFRERALEANRSAHEHGRGIYSKGGW